MVRTVNTRIPVCTRGSGSARQEAWEGAQKILWLGPMPKINPNPTYCGQNDPTLCIMHIRDGQKFYFSARPVGPIFRPGPARPVIKFFILGPFGPAKIF